MADFSVCIVMLAIFDFVTMDPEWVVWGGGHTKGSHVPLISVVESAHVVRNIKAELVVLVIESAVESHRTFDQVLRKCSVFNLKNNVFIYRKSRLSKVVCKCKEGNIGSIWLALRPASLDIFNPRENNSLNLSVPNGFWALWMALPALRRANIALDVPWASSVFDFTIENVDCHCSVTVTSLITVRTHCWSCAGVSLWSFWIVLCGIVMSEVSKESILIKIWVFGFIRMWWIFWILSFSINLSCWNNLCNDFGLSYDLRLSYDFSLGYDFGFNLRLHLRQVLALSGADFIYILSICGKLCKGIL